MIKGLCLKWADDSREVQSVAGGITVQKQERQVSEPPLSEPQIYFSQNGCRRDFKGGPLFDPQLEDATSHLKKAICVILESVEVSESAPFAG